MMELCPSLRELTKYLTGMLNPTLTDAIDNHLDDCTRCEEVVCDLERNLHRRLQLVKPPDEYYAQEPGAWISKSLLHDIASNLTKYPASNGVAHALKAGERIDDFLIVRELGQGGFANVYLAQQISLQRIVALKVSSHRSHEASLLSNLDHPNIVRVFDERWQQTSKTNLLYMQYVPGGSLKQALDRIGTTDHRQLRGIDLRRAIDDQLESFGDFDTLDGLTAIPANADWLSCVCRIGAKIGDALSYAHARGSLHRDIKPANILFTADGQPKLADFNLSFGASIEDTRPDDWFGGTIQYMSPEQLDVLLRKRSPDDVQPATDVFSLAVTLWISLARKHPFCIETQVKPSKVQIQTQLDQIRAGLRHSSHVQDVPQTLREFLESMLAFDWKLRPTAVDVSRILQFCAQGKTRALISPSTGSWACEFGNRPVWTMLLFGLLPSLIIAAINIAYNHQYLEIDSQLLQQDQLWVNPIVFPLAVIATLLYAVPLTRVLRLKRCGLKAGAKDLLEASSRCLHLPLVAATIAFCFWVLTGIIYPARQVEISYLGFFGFFVSQVAHGAIAASLTLMTLAFAVTRFLFPQLVWLGSVRHSLDRLSQLKRRVEVAFVVLAFSIPAVAICLSLIHLVEARDSDQLELSSTNLIWLYFCLGWFGVVSIAVARTINPWTNATIDTLVDAIASTSEFHSEKANHR